MDSKRDAYAALFGGSSVLQLKLAAYAVAVVVAAFWWHAWRAGQLRHV